LKAYIVSNPVETQELIDYVSSKILLYIECTDIFLNDDLVTYTYPDDLKQATAFLVESLFLLQTDEDINKINQDKLL
jgi:hypothetical protein